MFSKQQHYTIYLCSLILLVVALPFSKFLMSVSQFILLGNWIAEGNIKEKLNRLLNNRTALVLSSLIILHLLGLLYSSDISYAFKDIRIKTPLLLLPILLSTSTILTQQHFRWVIKFFIAAVCASTLVSAGIYWGIFHKPFVDIREISIFVSHIRLSLMICMAAFSGFYLMRNSASAERAIYLSITAWFVFFLTILESLTGLGILLALSVIFYIRHIFRVPRKLYRMIHSIILLAVICFMLGYINNRWEKFNRVNYIDVTSLESKTPNNHGYYHNLNSKQKENGNYVQIYVCREELEDAWPRKSKMPVRGKDKKGNDLEETLIRYLTSKGLRKDLSGVNCLSEKDIQNIEAGVPNYFYADRGRMDTRVYEVMWEIDNYKNGDNPSGHSVIQRLEYWKAAFGIIAANPIIGVGTGDIPKAFDNWYARNNSPLQPEWRLRSHNQFFAIGVAFGITGLLWFLFTLFYPLWRTRPVWNYLYLVFVIISSLSMLSEDTLETQAGVTFFAFFNSFLLFCSPDWGAHAIPTNGKQHQ